MRNGSRISVIIPALNEEKAIGKVIAAIPAWVDDVIVVDNGSTDNTPAIAAAHGARVAFEPRRGYGRACMTGIELLEQADIVVFLDGDFSDYPQEADRLVDPIIEEKADLVIGSRTRGLREAGALTPQAIFGNWLACTLIGLLWKVRFTDLGPFRAIRFSSLQRLGMCDPITVGPWKCRSRRQRPACAASKRPCPTVNALASQKFQAPSGESLAREPRSFTQFSAIR